MALLATLSSMSSIVSGIGPAFQMIGQVAGKVFGAIKDFIVKYLVDPIKDFFEGFKGFLGDVKEKFGDLLGWIAEKFDAWIIQPIAGFFEWLGGALGTAKDKFGDMLSWIAEKIDSWVVQPIAGFFSMVGNGLSIMKEKFGDALGWVKDKIFNALEKPIRAIVDTVTEVKDAITGVFDGFKISDVFTLKWWKKLFGGILDIGKSVIGGLIDIIKTPFNFLIAVINKILSKIKFKIKIPSWIPKIGGKKFGIDLSSMQIPMLAKGGIVNKPTLAMIGEDGPEAVIPLNKKNNPSGVGMGGTYNITVNAGGITDRTDKRALAREIGNMIQQELARSMGGSTHRGRF